MNAKFYVPFETAKLLKEKGYPQGDSYYYYSTPHILDSPYRPYLLKLYVLKKKYKGNDLLKIMKELYAAPAYCEVIDWLVGKDIYIDVDVDRTGYLLFEGGLRWYCYIWGRDGKTGCRNTRGYETREQAINEAIVKVLKDMI